MLEKRFRAVPPQSFTANGTPNGVVTIAGEACTLFKVKQRVIITASTLPPLNLEVKEIDSEGNIQVGPVPDGKPGVNTSIDARTDVSAYTVVLGAAISANEQRRPSIDWAEAMRAMYEEEPTVAMRSVLVDECGDKINNTNPLPVAFDGTVSIGDVSIVEGGNTMTVNSDGSINVNIVSSSDTPGLIISHNEVTAVASGVETTLITLVSPSDTYRVEKIEVSGDNLAIFRVKLNGTTILDKRTWYANFNETFNFEAFNNGLLLSTGQILTVTVLHTRQFVGNFEVTVMAVN